MVIYSDVLVGPGRVFKLLLTVSQRFDIFYIIIRTTISEILFVELDKLSY